MTIQEIGTSCKIHTFENISNKVVGYAIQSNCLLPAVSESILLVDDHSCQATVYAPLCENIMSSTKPEVQIRVELSHGHR